MPILRGEIYFVELGPVRGKELDNKRRPVLVVSINDINRKPLVVTVVPGKTHNPVKKVFRNQVKVEPSPDNGLRNPTIFECIQVKALDHSRFDRNPVGVVSAKELLKIEQAMKLCMGLS